MSRGWEVGYGDDLWTQIQKSPEEVRLRALTWINRKLKRSPLPRGGAGKKNTQTHDKVAPIRSGQRDNTKVEHARIGGSWRLNYVVLKPIRSVFVYECGIHERGNGWYTEAHSREVLAAARRRFPNPATGRVYR